MEVHLDGPNIKTTRCGGYTQIGSVLFFTLVSKLDFFQEGSVQSLNE